MNKSYKIIIPGNPIALKRHRHTKLGHTYNSQSKIMEQIGWQAKTQFPYNVITVPVLVEFTFFLRIPNSLSKKKKVALDGKYVSKRPDTSNYIKLYVDALNGFIWLDDALIVELTARKLYSLDDPRTEIIINII